MESKVILSTHTHIYIYPIIFKIFAINDIKKKRVIGKGKEVVDF